MAALISCSYFVSSLLQTIFFCFFFYLTAKRDVVEEDHTLLSVVTNCQLVILKMSQRGAEREREKERERQRSQLCLDLLSAP